MLTGHRDTDLIVLLELDDREFLIFCGKKESLQFKNKYINNLCNSETLWRDRLFKYYGQFYPEPGQTWKDLYLRLVYHLDEYEYEKDNKSFINAVERGHLSVVKYLLSLPEIIDPATQNNWAIRRASYIGYLSVIKYLMSLPKERKVDPTANNNESIIYASRNGHLDVVKYLIGLSEEYGIDPTAEDNAAIRMASKNKHLDIVKYLMSLPKEYGIDPTADDNFAIRWAIDYRNSDIINYLMSLPKEYGILYGKGVDPNDFIFYNNYFKENKISFLKIILQDERLNKEGLLKALSKFKLSKESKFIIIQKLKELGVTKKDLKSDKKLKKIADKF